MKKFLAFIVLLGCSVHASDSGTSSYDGTAVSSSDKHFAQSRRPGKKKKSNRGEGDILSDLLKEQRKTNKLLARLLRVGISVRRKQNGSYGSDVPLLDFDDYAQYVIDKK